MTLPPARCAPQVVALAAALGLAACSRDVNLPGRDPLVAVPDAAAVAPRQTVALSAQGGAGHYAFRFAAGSPRSGALATLDAATGAYRAGAGGSCEDDVEIVDAAGQVVTARISVGTALALASTVIAVPTGGVATLSASGGLAPYRYGFAPRGNRSAGAVDAVTGAYVAGPNAGALDLVQATDAAGAVATLPVPIHVGGLRVEVPGGIAEVRAGDLNGDGRDDLVYLAPAGGARRMTAAFFPPRSTPFADTYWLAGTALGLATFDLDGSGRDDVVVANTSGVELLLGSPSGALVPGPGLAPYASPDAQIAAGKYYASPHTCALTRIAWSGAAPAPVCAFGPGGVSVGPAIALASGDLSGEGTRDDAAFVDGPISPSIPINTPALRFAFDVAGVPTQSNGLAPPGGTAILLGNGGDHRHQLATGWFSTRDRETVAALLTRDARNVVRFTTPWTAWPAAWSPLEVDPFPADAPAIGIAGCPPAPAGSPVLLAWNGTGRLAVLGFDPGGVSSAILDAAAYPITAATCADVNGDGIPDLVVAGSSAAQSDVLLGDGDGGWGRRPRFAVGGAVAIGDLDGDGVGDLVMASATPGLQTLFGGDHQLAAGPETRVSSALDVLAVGDLSGAHGAGWTGDVVFQTPLGAQYVARGLGDGTFAAPDPLPAYTGLSSDLAHADGMVVAELGGTAPGRDVLAWHVIPALPASPALRYPSGKVQLAALVRDAGGARRVSFARAGATTAVQPLDRDGDGIPDAVALLQTVNAPAGAILGLDLPTFASVYTAGTTTFDPLFVPTPFELGGRLSAVGTFGDAAVFASVGAPTQLAVVRTAGVRLIGSPVATFAGMSLRQVVPGAPPTLLVTDGQGLLRLFDPVVDGQGQLTGFTPAGTIGAPGALLGVAPQRGGAAGDVLLRAGDEVVPLVHDGPGGALR